MNTLRILPSIVILALGLADSVAPTRAASIHIEVAKPGARVSPTLWGLFFEDINCSADGGVYAELIRNRSFEDSEQPAHWSLVRGAGEAEIAVTVENPMSSDEPTGRNRRSLRWRISDASPQRPAGLANDGYWGIAVKEGARYLLSLHARASNGFTGPLSVSLENREGAVLAATELRGLSSAWQRFTLPPLIARATEPKARLVLRANQPGTVWLDMVSLFPEQTWKGHGLRPDLMEMLAGLKPSFARFPGGCWVEGDTMKLAYRWKETIGDPAQRRTHYNIWQYYATHGLGFHEYLQMCEDLQAEPLFVINCGMSHRENVPLDQMGPFVQDALDAIEYCNGPVTSRYGALRAQQGHPAPFNLKYLEIGNENGGPAYQERWLLFHRAIKARYPQIQLIANVWGGYPTNEMPDIVDEHYYSNPEFFMAQANRYDRYDRKKPKVYVGEYAVTQNGGQGNLRGALGEAAFMTGLERNADVVVMASYAPLFANVNYKKWNPDLINFDSARAYGIPSYYVQKMFGEHRGDVVLPITLEVPLVEETPITGTLGVGTWLTRAEFKDIRVTRGNETLYASDFSEDRAGWKFLGGGDWKVQDGVLRQSSGRDNVRAILRDKKWTDYTYTLKARKLGGAEGFLILFRVGDEEAKSWWNLGGWGNKRHAIEMGGIVGNEVPGQIETGRWYDIRIEVKGSNIKCHLDGQLLHDVQAPKRSALYASATRQEASGETILKVVNVSSEVQRTEIKLNGASKVAASGQLIVLTSEHPTDENTLSQPTKVAPVTRTLETVSGSFTHAFPAHSLSILRMKATQ